VRANEGSLFQHAHDSNSTASLSINVEEWDASNLNSSTRFGWLGVVMVHPFSSETAKA